LQQRIQHASQATSCPAILFENVSGHYLPVLVNLIDVPERVAHAVGVSD
jgi:UbiD family decarboxylase